jgi:hypothetical protein
VIKLKALKLFFICLATVAAWPIVAFGAALYGWWTESVADDDDHEAFYHWAVNKIDTNGVTLSRLLSHRKQASQRIFISCIDFQFVSDFYQHN